VISLCARPIAYKLTAADNVRLISQTIKARVLHGVLYGVYNVNAAAHKVRTLQRV